MRERRDPDVPLDDEEVDALEYHGCSSGTSTPPMVRDAIVRATREIRRHRKTTAADEEHTRQIVTEEIKREPWLTHEHGIAGICITTIADRVARRLAVHGRTRPDSEAGELRRGIERLLADPPGGDAESNREWRSPLQRLLDSVSARDSLAHIERGDAVTIAASRERIRSVVREACLAVELAMAPLGTAGIRIERLDAICDRATKQLTHAEVRSPAPSGDEATATTLRDWEHHVRNERRTREDLFKEHGRRLYDGVDLPPGVGTSWCGDKNASLFNCRFMYLDAAHALDAVASGSWGQPCSDCLKAMRAVIDDALIEEPSGDAEDDEAAP